VTEDIGTQAMVVLFDGKDTESLASDDGKGAILHKIVQSATLMNHYLSVDTVAEVDQQSVYPVEYLNSLNLSRLRPHVLRLKVGAPIMLLRNMDPLHRHCNRTRYIIRQLGRRYIEDQIDCGQYAGNILMIPRIPLSPTDAGLPFTLTVTIACTSSLRLLREQGSRTDSGLCAGILLDEPVFTY